MSDFKTLIAKVKSTITEVTVEESKGKLGESLFLDVREPSETADGHVKGALLIPRGLLELRVEDRIADKARPIVLH